MYLKPEIKISIMFRLISSFYKTGATSQQPHLHPDEVGPCIRGEVVYDLLVSVRTIKILPCLQSDCCHPDPPLVAWRRQWMET